MFEDTHIEGTMPNTALIYSLRKFAFDGGELKGIIEMIFEQEECSYFSIIKYLGLAFGIPISLLKISSNELKNIHSASAETVNQITHHIEKNRAIWSKRLS